MYSKSVLAFRILMFLLLLLFSCSSPNGSDDNSPPSVRIISPQNNSIVTDNVKIICLATDNQKIEKLELWVNGSFTGIVSNSEPYEFIWDVTDYDNGFYIITVRAYDVNDNKTDSDPINLQIQSTIPIPMEIVAGGSFLMGDTWGDGDSNELPIHNVILDSFYIGKYEITQSQWDSLMSSNPSFFRGENHPVERITWFEALEFCNALSIHHGLNPCYNITGNTAVWDTSANGYRLPTEAEWEFAARGALLTQNYKYSGSDTPSTIAWSSENSGNTTHEVGQKLPNELGLYDMSGNVWEFCWDWMGVYPNSQQSNPQGPTTGTDKVVRGGAFHESISRIRVSERGTELPNSRGGSDYIGFRIVRSL